MSIIVITYVSVRFIAIAIVMIAILNTSVIV